MKKIIVFEKIPNDFLRRHHVEILGEIFKLSKLSRRRDGESKEKLKSFIICLYEKELKGDK